MGPGRELERSPAAGGKGPFLQRDYWARIRDSRLSPSEIGNLLATRFVDFSPVALARFERVGASDRPLEVGDELRVQIRLAGTFGVRVLHRNPNSVTLCTLRGHPEAGRITFGAYRDRAGNVIVHIRSRARSSTASTYAGFLTMGQPMQTNTWTDFIDRLANTVGNGVEGPIFEETAVIEDDDEDRPTYLAKGD